MARSSHAIYISQAAGNFQAPVLLTRDRARLGGGFHPFSSRGLLCSSSTTPLAAFSATSSRLLSLSEDDSSDISSVGFRRSTRMEAEKYSKELDVAVRLVQMACSLCQRVQTQLVGRTRDEIKSKDDDSPVTVAGCAFLLFFFFGWCGLFNLFLLCDGYASLN